MPRSLREEGNMGRKQNLHVEAESSSLPAWLTVISILLCSKLWRMKLVLAALWTNLSSCN